MRQTEIVREDMTAEQADDPDAPRESAVLGSAT